MSYPKIEKRANDLAAKVCQLWETSGSPVFLVQSENERQFIETLPETQKETLLTALDLCNAEIAYLEQSYGVTTISKKLQPIYRKAMSKISGVTQYRSLPLALFTFSGTKTVNDDTRSKVETATENLIPVTEKQLNQLIEKAIDFLYCDGEDNYSIAKLALGIGILTGRRIYKEVCLQAEFYPVLDDSGKIDPSRLSFYGQAKSGNDRKGEGYEIETLFDATEIYNGHLDLLDMVKDTTWYQTALANGEGDNDEDSNSVQSVLHYYVNRVIKNELLPIFQETVDAGYPVNLVAKDTRKLYATVCHNRYVQKTGKRISFEVYAAKLLGHQKTSKTGKKFKDTVTAQSYNKFSVVSGEGIPDINVYWQ